MEWFIIPNKNKNRSLIMQALMIVKQYQLLLSVRIVNLWPWDSKVTKNLAFITMN